MGVERFFSSLRRDYNFINDLRNKLECEHVLIDFNSIVHVTSQFLLERLKKDSSMTKHIFETKLIEKVGEYIITMLETQFNPRTILTITICVDGVPSMAKIYEQKKRRYMGDIMAHLNSHPSSFSWSRNNISPGTEFMNNMMDYLNSAEFDEMIKKICHNIKHYNVSGIDSFGEGEIKILHYIDTLMKTKYGNDRYVVYSPDSDVIILLLMTDINVTMLRYDQQKSTEMVPVYSTVDINMFKNILYDYVANKLNKKPDKMKIIMDIVFILTVFGDDFLPKLETVRVNTDINIIIDHYVVILIKYGYILNSDKMYSINTENFYHFLLLLQQKEEYFLHRNARYHVSSNYNRIETDIVGYKMNILRELMVEYIWKFIYYNKPKLVKVSPVNVHKMISFDKFIDFMNNPEPDINMSKFTNMTFKNKLLWDKMVDIVKEHYIELLHYIDSKKMVKENIYPNESYYVTSLPNQLLKDILLYFYLKDELPITIPLKTSHDKIMLNNYNSMDNPHKNRINKLEPIERELYKMENKLDKYYKIFNPKDKFYYNVYNMKTINYNEYYSLNFPHEKIISITNDYMLGLNWVVSYYHNNNAKYKGIDMTWYYRHNRSPLLKDIITYYNMKILTNHFNDKFKKIPYMTPIEHYVFVSPFNVDKSLHEQLLKGLGEINKIKIKEIERFIKNHPKYYFIMDNIYKDMKDKRIIDCSGSHFISKCHLLFMERYINMFQFILDYRKSIL